MNNDLQSRPGRLTACCSGLNWALACRYIKKGYMWWVEGKRSWTPWTLNISGRGYRDVSPIGFCPFCGANLDKPED